MQHLSSHRCQSLLLIHKCDLQLLFLFYILSHFYINHSIKGQQTDRTVPKSKGKDLTAGGVVVELLLVGQGFERSVSQIEEGTEVYSDQLD